jgi:hypothetical protein
VNSVGRQSPDVQDAEAVAVEKLKGKAFLADLLPKPPNPEPALPHIDVVQKHNGAIGELRQP